MNGDDGLAITGAGTVTDLALSNVTLMSNTGNGLHVVGGTIAPQSGVMGSFGMLIDSSTIASNATDGIRIEADATDVILKGDIIADNDGDGVFIAGTVDDLVIQDSHLGAIDVDGNPMSTGDNFRGNGSNGIDIQFSQLTGVAFLNSTFNGNGTGASGVGDGIFIIASTINSGQVEPVGNMPFDTGFTLQDSQVVGNTSNGIDFDGVTATDVTFNKDIIAANKGAGVFIRDDNTTDAFASIFTDFVIQDSYLGAAPNGSNILLGNSVHGFEARHTTFNGVAFLDSFSTRTAPSARMPAPASCLTTARSNPGRSNR